MHYMSANLGVDSSSHFPFRHNSLQSNT